jgi:ABC-2 type transport system permease protein
MGTIALLVGKDLRRRARSPLGFLIVLSFPIVFSLLIALSFGGHGDRIPKVHLLVENLDDEMGGNALLSALTSEQMAEYLDVEVVGSEGAERIGKGEASALLRIPDRFTEDVIASRPVTLSLLRNPAQGILPEIGEQMLRVMVDVFDSGTRVLRQPLDELEPYIRKGAVRITDESVISIALAVKRAVESADTFLDPVAISFDTASLAPKPVGTAGQTSPVSSIFLFILPGVSVYALFLVADLSMRDLIAEGTAGTLRRQLAGPIRAATLVVAKAISAAALSVIALVVLAAVGGFVLRRSVDPLGFVILSAAMVLAVTGTSAALYGIARNEQRGGTIGGIVYLVLAFGGGSFVSLDTMPGVMKAIAPISPFYWGTTGFKKLLEPGGSAADVLQSVAVLSGLGIVLLALGSLLLHRAVRRGGFTA